MSDKPEALRIADLLELCGSWGCSPSIAAAELRRVHAINGELVEALKGVLPYMEAAEAAGLVGDEGCHWPVESARAALSRAQGEAK